MLTSAGDNTFDYLLDNPATIDCVDLNPAQNALLELKQAFYQTASYQQLWEWFGEGRKPAPERLYYQQLRPLLSRQSRAFWDGHINFFAPTVEQPSFYFHGTSGKIAGWIHKKIKRKGLYPQVLQLLGARSLEEQSFYYREIEPQLWDNLQHWLLPRQSVMTMLGVPASQRRMIEQHCKGGITQFIRQSLECIFTERPLHDNYFWRVYLTGSYTPGCCPNYLRKEHFDTIASRSPRIHSHTCSLLDYLKDNPKTYSHIILLDHQDWLADFQPHKLAEEWRHLLKASRPGTRILFRSVTGDAEFLPGFVHNHIAWQPQLTHPLHQKDRVGTYESTHLGIVQ